MKCLHCYAENPAWQTLCSACGEPVTPIELCAAGHILPPGVRECAVCPTLWPATTPFAGPPILRGLLWIDAGELRGLADAGPLPFLELRDGETPVAIVASSPLTASLGSADHKDTIVRILVRPDGVSACTRPGAPRGGSAASKGGRPASPRYEPLAENAPVEVERVRLRFVPIQAPAWIHARAGR